MSRRIFRKLVTVEDAKERLLRHFEPHPTGIVSIPLHECVGRVLAENVEAMTDVPPFDRASMDGFAVRAEDTFRAEEERPVSIRVLGMISAGENPDMSLNDGEAIEISTGAAVPKGANAVVMVENTWRIDDAVKIFRAVVVGENITAAGSDIMAGELVLRMGDLLTPRDTGVLAALGVTEVRVFKKPLIAVISTGNEVIPPGDPLTYGKVYDINARTISDSIVENGGTVSFLGIARDDISEIRSRLEEAIKGSDMVVTSGGTSAGFGDLIYRLINDLGEPGIIVHGVSIKPGKPLIIAVVDNKVIFCLPGYPTSALMTFNVFVRPLLRNMAGLRSEVERKIVEGKTAGRIFPPHGRRTYMPVNLVQTIKGDYMIYPVPGGSGAITTLSGADGFIEIPADTVFLEEGESVIVELFSMSLMPADLMIIGSHCVGIDILLDLIRKKHFNFKFKVINTGSSGGLVAIRRGEADIAGVHLLDSETGEYNLPFLERYEVDEKAVLIRGYVREQGLILQKGNPNGIHGLKDLFDGEHSFINRNLGSGTRLLLDMLLRPLAEEENIIFDRLVSRINGYGFEAKSHSAVAFSILQGKAEAGLGLKACADRYGLDFIPLAKESYDFLVQKTRLEKSSVKTFIEVLGSGQFRSELPLRTVGLHAVKDTGSVVHPKGLKL